MKFFLSIFCLFLPALGTCVDYKPWLGEMLEFEWRNSVFYQTYPEVASGSHFKKKSSDDYFLNTSLSTSYMEYGLELEATEAWTKRQSGDIDNLKATLRYVWLDDIAGDPISLTSGLSFTQSFVPSLHDISSFHHGRREFELFLSLGKEKACGEVWVRRWWTVLGCGIAERGSPWLRLNAAYDVRASERQEWRLFCNTLWGLGEHRLHVHHFDGYGSIEHRSIDLGVRFTYLIDYFGSLSFQYSNRVYARNFPARTSVFMVELLYLFGL